MLYKVRDLKFNTQKETPVLQEIYFEMRMHKCLGKYIRNRCPETGYS